MRIAVVDVITNEVVNIIIADSLSFVSSLGNVFGVNVDNMDCRIGQVYNGSIFVDKEE